MKFKQLTEVFNDPKSAKRSMRQMASGIEVPACSKCNSTQVRLHTIFHRHIFHDAVVPLDLDNLPSVTTIEFQDTKERSTEIHTLTLFFMCSNCGKTTSVIRNGETIHSEWNRSPKFYEKLVDLLEQAYYRGAIKNKPQM